VHEDRFSGAASSDDPEDLPFIHVKGYIVKNQGSAKLYTEISDG